MVVDPLLFSWRSHEKEILSTFRELLLNGELVDVTLACDGATLEVHKMVLSACSMYFRSLFQKNSCKHPIVIVGNVKYRDIKALVDFMYSGNISVPKEHLSDFLKTAKLLQIRGLEARLEDVIQNSSNTTQSNDRELILHENAERLAPATSFTRQSVPRNNSWANLENECLQEEVSVHTNDETEFMEAVVVKDEPEDSYNEFPDVEPYHGRLSPFASSQSNVEPEPFTKERLNAEQRKPQSSTSKIFQSDGPNFNARASLSSDTSSGPVVLPESITSGEGNQGSRPQPYLVTFGEPPKIVQSFSFSNACHSPRKGMTFEIQTSPSNIASEEEPSVVLQKVSNADPSPRKEVASNIVAPMLRNMLNSRPLEVSGVGSHVNDNPGSSSTFASLKRKPNFFQSSPKRKRFPVNYIQLSKFGKSQLPTKTRITSRPFDPDFDCKCAQRCAGRIPPAVRCNIFKKFWSLENYAQQSAFIRNTIFGEDLDINKQVYKRKRNHRRRFKRIYKLGGIVVCYQMYAKTLRINTERINKALGTPRLYGSHIKFQSHLSGCGKYRLPETKIREVIGYLEKFFDSHNNNTDVPADFNNHSLHGLYTRYKQNAVLPVTYYHFAKIFRNNFTSPITRRNDKVINSDLKSCKDEAKGIELRSAGHFTKLQTTAEQSTSNRDVAPATISSKQLPLITENARSSSDTVSSSKTGITSCFRKLTANKIRKVVDHFNKLFNSTSQRDKVNAMPSNQDLQKTYKIYKKEVIVPVSFYSYVKIFNINFRQTVSEGSTKGAIRHTSAENSNSTQECGTSETSAKQRSTGQVSRNPLTPNETKKVIEHFNEFYNNPPRYKRIGFSAKSSDPPLQKMYEIYKKDMAIPVSFDHYVNIFHTSFKNRLNEKAAIKGVNDTAIKDSKTIRSKKKETTEQQRSIRVGALPVNKIEEVTDHFNKFYDNPSRYKRIGFSVKSTDPPLHKMYKIYKNDVTLPVKFHHYHKIFYARYKNSLRKTSETDKAHSSKATAGVSHVKQREHLEKSQLADKDFPDSQIHSSGKDDHLFSQRKRATRNVFPSVRNILNPKSSANSSAKLSSRGSHIKPKFEKIKNKRTVSQTNKSVGQETFDDLSPIRIAEVIDHFKEFYDFVSNQNEANVPLEFVNYNLPLMKMYKLYRAEAEQPVSYYHFFHIFRVNFKCRADQSKSQNKEINQAGKSNGKDSRQNAEANSLIQNESISVLQRQTGPGLQSDVYKDAKCQNVVVCLDKLNIPLPLQETQSNSKADEERSSCSDSKRDSVNVQTMVESGNISDNDPKQNSTNISTVVEKVTPCNSTLSEMVSKSDLEHLRISSTDSSSRTETLAAEDMKITSKLVAEMIEIIERDSKLVDDMNYIADEENVTFEDNLLFSKEMDITPKGLLEQTDCTLSDNIAINSNEVNSEKCDALHTSNTEKESTQNDI